MITKIPLLNNNFNFSTTVFINNFEFFLRFIWNKRADIYKMDIGRSFDNILLAGIPLITGVQLNRTILNEMEGVLYLVSENREEIANPKNLGKTIHMVHYG